MDWAAIWKDVAGGVLLAAALATLPLSSQGPRNFSTLNRYLLNPTATNWTGSLTVRRLAAPSLLGDASRNEYST
jgi:hypothetical protein